MRKLFIFCCVVLIFGCKKGDSSVTPPSNNQPTKVLRLNSIFATAASGANLSFISFYEDSLLSKIVRYTVNAGDSIVYLFNYAQNKISSVDFYYNDPSNSKAPYTRLAVTYSENKISKVEFLINQNNKLVSSSFIEYNYDLSGNLIEKKTYVIVAGTPVLYGDHNYFYDANNDIIKEVSNNSSGNTIEFDNSFYTSDNIFFKNNPAMLIFYWYLFDLNQLREGFPEIQIYSKHNLSATTRLYGVISKKFNFDMQITDNLWQSISIYPNVYDDSNDILFYQMNFGYILHI